LSKTKHKKSHRDSLQAIKDRLSKIRGKVPRNQSCDDLIIECLKRIDICMNNEERRNVYHKAQLDSLKGKLKKAKNNG